MTVTESFEHTQRISQCLEPSCTNLASFHYPKYFQSQLHVDVPRSQWSCGVQGGIWGWHGGLGQAGCQKGPPIPTYRTTPPFQLCCCGSHKNGSVSQPLDCLSDGQAMTTPLVRAWAGAGAPWSSCGRGMRRAWGARGRR